MSTLSFLNETPTIGIIGTAGRGMDYHRLNKDVYDKMYSISREIIGNNTSYIISGGAAWSDHIAVRLFLESPEFHHLQLELPCYFCNGKYDTNILYDNMHPGAISNHYHELFSLKIGKQSLKEIQQAIDLGCRVNIGKGFFDRNSQISKADTLIAFTYGDGPKLKDGGTSDTAKKYINNGGNRLIHINLNDFKMYEFDYFPE